MISNNNINLIKNNWSEFSYEVNDGKLTSDKLINALENFYEMVVGNITKKVKLTIQFQIKLEGGDYPIIFQNSFIHEKRVTYLHYGNGLIEHYNDNQSKLYNFDEPVTHIIFIYKIESI
jgi:hypothetical protein